MTEPKQKIEPKLSTVFRKIVTGGSLSSPAVGGPNARITSLTRIEEPIHDDPTSFAF